MSSECDIWKSSIIKHEQKTVHEFSYDVWNTRTFHHRGSTVVKVLRYKSEGRWFDPSCCHWIFHWHKILPIDPASKRNEYQEYFLGGKDGRCLRLTTLPPSCAAVTKSENPNFLEPSGPLRACNGTALPFTVTAKISEYLCDCHLLLLKVSLLHNFTITVISCRRTGVKKACVACSTSYLHMMHSFTTNEFVGIETWKYIHYILLGV